jgi:hypothetical protein
MNFRNKLIFCGEEFLPQAGGPSLVWCPGPLIIIIKYMLLSRHPNAGQKSHDIKIANKYSETVSQFRYLGTTVRVTNQNLIQEKIKRLNSGNACYHSVQNLLSSRLLSRNKNLNTHNYNFACGPVWV